MSETRDSWSKIDILAKSLGAIAIPLALFVLSSNQQKHNNIEEKNRRAEDLRRDSFAIIEKHEEHQAQLDQESADRATALVQHVTSDKPQERELALYMLEKMANRGLVPPYMLEVPIILSRTDPNAAVRSTALKVSQGIVANQLRAIPVKTETQLLSTNAGIAASPIPRATDIQLTVDRVVRVRNLGSYSQARILWVDDKPANNSGLAETFASLGIHVDTALNTFEAERRLLAGPAMYDIIISDLGRVEGHHAGFELLRWFRSVNRATPFFLYTARTSVSERREADRLTASGMTNVPAELVQMVTDALRTRRPSG